MRGKNIENAFVETKVRMKTRNPQRGGTEDVKEQSWDEGRVVLITKNFYEMHEQKANCCVIKRFEEGMYPQTPCQ